MTPKSIAISGHAFVPSPRKLLFDCKPKGIDTDIATIPTFDNGTLVNVKAAVVRVAPGRTVSTGVVQEVTITDSTGSVALTLWNNNIDKFHENSTYTFTALKVDTYRDNKILNFNNNSSFIEVEHLDSEQLPLNDLPTDSYTIKAHLVGIQGYKVHMWCLQCHSKVQFGETFALCDKCELLQQTSVNYCLKASNQVMNPINRY